MKEKNIAIPSLMINASQVTCVEIVAAELKAEYSSP